MNIYLIILEDNYGDINADDYTCHGYYIIKFSSSPYNFQTYLSIERQVILPGKIVYEGNVFPNQYQFSLLCFQK